MQNDEEIEALLWDYIDGRCDENECERIKQLIATNNIWKHLFEELNALHKNIPDHMELEEPPMRFTQNVMDLVSKTSIAPATKKYINKYIIRGIAAFFIATLGALLISALAGANWHNGKVHLFSQTAFEKLHLDSLLNSNIINIIIAVNIMLILLFIDSIFRKKSFS